MSIITVNYPSQKFTKGYNDDNGKLQLYQITTTYSIIQQDLKHWASGMSEYIMDNQLSSLELTVK